MKQGKFLIVLLLAAVLAAFSCSKTTRDIQRENVTRVDSLRIMDSVRIKDSIHIMQRDSIVLREGVSTSFSVQPCDSNSIKPFSYVFNKGNVFVKVAAESDGQLSVDINLSNEILYRQKLIEQYVERARDSVAHHYRMQEMKETKYIHKTIVKKFVPLWIWLTIVILCLLLILTFKFKF